MPVRATEISIPCVYWGGWVRPVYIDAEALPPERLRELRAEYRKLCAGMEQAAGSPRKLARAVLRAADDVASRVDPAYLARIEDALFYDRITVNNSVWEDQTVWADSTEVA